MLINQNKSTPRKNKGPIQTKVPMYERSAHLALAYFSHLAHLGEVDTQSIPHLGCNFFLPIRSGIFTTCAVGMSLDSVFGSHTMVKETKTRHEMSRKKA